MTFDGVEIEYMKCRRYIDRHATTYIHSNGVFVCVCFLFYNMNRVISAHLSSIWIKTKYWSISFCKYWIWNSNWLVRTTAIFCFVLSCLHITIFILHSLLRYHQSATFTQFLFVLFRLNLIFFTFLRLNDEWMSVACRADGNNNNNRKKNRWKTIAILHAESIDVISCASLLLFSNIIQQIKHILNIIMCS